VLFLFLIGFVGLSLRLAYIQGVRQNYYRNLAATIHGRTIPAPAPRGKILDRNGGPLVTNMQAWDVTANPQVILKTVKDPALTAAALAQVIGGDAETYRKQLDRQKGSYFALLARRIDTEVADKLRAAIKDPKNTALKGLELIETTKRVHPCGNLASVLLGYTNTEGIGIEALELSLNKHLQGKDGYIVADVDAMGGIIPATEREVKHPVAGKDVRLALDGVIQEMAERELGKAVEQYNPESAIAIVMDVRSGDVLALANFPSYNPERRGEATADQRRNRAIVDAYEPGSTFKVFTAAAAMEAGLPTDGYCPGAAMIGKHRIKCAHNRAHGQCDLRRTIEQSCNVVTGQLAQRLGAQKLYDYVKAFGFTQRTGIELTGETYGWLGKPEEWPLIRTVNVGFGQGVAVTPMAMATAYNAIANDGMLVAPRMVKEIGGKPLAPAHPPRRVMTPDNAAKLRELMESVVTDGTGKNAKIAHYRAAGKTGTAQIARNGGYVGGAYVASFIGFMPVQQPRLTIFVSVTHPKGAQYGGTVSAPVFREISRQAVRYLNIPPDSAGDERDGVDRGSFERWKRKNGITTTSADAND
jgi:stage V sporulation protein D (sporulation-specific penicillin-binding protein)